MDLKAIKQVVELMQRSELSEFEIEEEGFKLRLSRKQGKTQIINPAQMPAPPFVSLPSVPVSKKESEVKEAVKSDDDETIFVIKSPMVGTFYSAASPDSPAFVKPGDTVSADSIVCIIEAMKVMNEIHAETKGIISEILVENGEAVEYGQPLFKVKKT